MMIKKEIYSWNPVAGFTPGLLLTVGAGGAFLALDAFHPAAALFSLDGGALAPVPLAEPVQLDAALLQNNRLSAADFPKGLIHRWTVSLEKGSGLRVFNYESVELPLNARFVAMREFHDHILVLDKNACMIRKYDSQWRLLQSIGSRMGYFLESNSQPRLGFEFPEDMIVTPDRVLVSDSGNKRLVVLDHDLEMVKTIPLPDYPFKFIFCSGDYAVVSDFDTSLMVVSLEHGCAGAAFLDFAADFAPALCLGGEGWIASEAGNELIRLTAGAINGEQLAREQKRCEPLMRMLISAGRLPEAREIALLDPLLPVLYANLTLDAAFDADLAQHLTHRVQTILRETGEIRERVQQDCRAYLACYKAIPGAADPEAAQIARENVRYRIFNALKSYRALLRDLAQTRRIPAVFEQARAAVAHIFDHFFPQTRRRIDDASEHIEHIISQFTGAAPFPENDILRAIADYWLWTETDALLFPEKSQDYKKWFPGLFLLEILKDFYYHIAGLYLQRDNDELYIRFADLELTMFPDKMGIFIQFVERLMRLAKYDNILHMLKKFPDQNRENVNWCYSWVFSARGETDKAFEYLKKEIDLYAHRTDLIPQLLQMNRLSAEDARLYINRILEKAGHAIDTHYNAALAFKAVGDHETAERHVDMELEQYPENRPAILLKAELFLGRPVPRRDREYCSRCWKYLRAFIVNNQEARTAQQTSVLFAALDGLDIDEALARQVRGLAERTPIDVYRNELDIFLAFIGLNSAETSAAPEGGVVLNGWGSTGRLFETGDFLTACSTAGRTRRLLLARASQLRDRERWHDMFTHLETILKYYPGDGETFAFLDALQAETAEVKRENSQQ